MEIFQTVVEYVLSFLSTLREKGTLMVSLWKYLKFSIKKFNQSETMVFRVQFATLVMEQTSWLVIERWQTPNKKWYAFVRAAVEKIKLFPNPAGYCPKTFHLPTMFSSFCSDFNSLTGNTAKLSLGAYWRSSTNLTFSVTLAILWKTLLPCEG